MEFELLSQSDTFKGVLGSSEHSLDSVDSTNVGVLALQAISWPDISKTVIQVSFVGESETLEYCPCACCWSVILFFDLMSIACFWMLRFVSASKQPILKLSSVPLIWKVTSSSGCVFFCSLMITFPWSTPISLRSKVVVLFRLPAIDPRSNSTLVMDHTLQSRDYQTEYQFCRQHPEPLRQRFAFAQK